jgi:hypothetical protein
MKRDTLVEVCFPKLNSPSRRVSCYISAPREDNTQLSSRYPYVAPALEALIIFNPQLDFITKRGTSAEVCLAKRILQSAHLLFCIFQLVLKAALN